MTATTVAALSVHRPATGCAICAGRARWQVGNSPANRACTRCVGELLEVVHEAEADGFAPLTVTQIGGAR